MNKTYNELIAEFDGWIPANYGTDTRYWISADYEKRGWTSKEFKYNTSWDWLMPVVEKIESIGFFLVIKPTSVELYSRIPVDLITANGGETKLEAVYKTIVEFIKWFNSQKV